MPNLHYLVAHNIFIEKCKEMCETSSFLESE